MEITDLKQENSQDSDFGTLEESELQDIKRHYEMQD